MVISCRGTSSHLGDDDHGYFRGNMRKLGLGIAGYLPFSRKAFPSYPDCPDHVWLIQGEKKQLVRGRSGITFVACH